MKLIFNKNNSGQEEIKKLLGFLDADISYENLETDIVLNIPNLIEFIGQEMYDKLLTHYEASVEDEALDAILTNSQLYVLLLAYLDYSPNADLIHGNNGRKMHFSESEKTPWDWQIAMDNGALKRRAYKSLDALIQLLDKSTYAEWTGSDQYKKAKALFLYNTAQLQDIFPVNNSGQLYYRLVAFMPDVEIEVLRPALGQTKFDDLKSKVKGSPSADEKLLILYCQKITAFTVLARGSELLPEEMMSTEINYRLSESDRELIREKRAAKFLKMARTYELELERILTKQANALDPLNPESTLLNPTRGITPGKKHVSL